MDAHQFAKLLLLHIKTIAIVTSPFLEEERGEFFQTYKLCVGSVAIQDNCSVRA